MYDFIVDNICTATVNTNYIEISQVSVSAEEFLSNASEDQIKVLDDFLPYNGIELTYIIHNPTAYVIVLFGDSITEVYMV